MAFYDHECSHTAVGMDAVAGRTRRVPGESAVVCLGLVGEMGELPSDNLQDSCTNIAMSSQRMPGLTMLPSSPTPSSSILTPTPAARGRSRH
jgi:hypothetical protein